MKTYILILLFCLGSITMFANAIDSLKTKEDVVKFMLAKVLDSGWNESNIFSKESSHQGYYKIDLNNDGLTDLIVVGYSVLFVIDNGNGKFTRSSIDQGTLLYNEFTDSNIVETHGKKMIVAKGQKMVWSDSSNRKLRKWEALDTLVFIGNRPVEYNPKPNPAQMESICFQLYGCFGDCPVLTLNVHANRTAELFATRFRNQEGMYSCKLDEAFFKNMETLLSYMKVNTLIPYYSVPWSDAIECTLDLELKDGTHKEILDYGMIGTYGLQHLYHQLFELCKTGKWNKL